MAPRQQGASVMVSEYVYSPHVDFFIDRVERDTGYEMASFHCMSGFTGSISPSFIVRLLVLFCIEYM